MLTYYHMCRAGVCRVCCRNKHFRPVQMKPSYLYQSVIIVSVVWNHLALDRDYW
jgi:hypothetical protein